MDTNKAKRPHCESPGCWDRVLPAPKRLPLAWVHDEGCVPIDATRSEIEARVEKSWIERRP